MMQLSALEVFLITFGAIASWELIVWLWEGLTER